MSTVKITLHLLPFPVHTEDGTELRMFMAEAYDHADDVEVVINAAMSRTKWEALGRPTTTEIELGEPE